MLQIFKRFAKSQARLFPTLETFEIFLDIPICELKKRDPKGIYRKFSLGKINNVAGLDLKIQKPTDPDLHITDCKAINTETIISHVIKRFSTSL